MGNNIPTLKPLPGLDLQSRMQSMDLAEVLKKNEGKTLEFKRDLSSVDKVLRTLVAFANTSGGILLIGVEDKTRKVIGVKDVLGMEEKLANLISDCITPRLIPDIEALPWRRTHIIGVQVHSSSVRPHYLKSAGKDHSVYVRVGSTNRQADQNMIEEIQRYVLHGSYDETPLPDLNPEDIDFRAASELFAEERTLKREDLHTLKILTFQQRKEVPTVGGILLLGKKRDRYFPDAWIQAGHFEGKDRTRILDSMEIKSAPVRAVDEAMNFIRTHTSKEMIIEKIRRVDHWTYPPVAVREAIINAVVHADYSQKGAPIRLSVFSDRLEIENPGLLPYGLTIDDIQAGISKLRNRVIGRFFHELKLIEQWGSGIGRMVSACRDHGLLPPVFEEIGTHFRVTIFNKKINSSHVGGSEQSIINVLSKEDSLSTAQIAQKIKRSARATRTQLISLVSKGLVAEIGMGPTDPKKKYTLVRK